MPNILYDYVCLVLDFPLKINTNTKKTKILGNKVKPIQVFLYYLYTY